MEGSELDVGELFRLLAEREAACRAEADRLRAEAERIGALLAACRQELGRLMMAREVVGELTVAYPGAAAAPVPGAGPAAPGGEVLTKQVLAVPAERGRPVRCREVVAGLGEDASVPRHVERVRHRLKKLHRAGQVAEVTPGMFTLAGAVGATSG